MKIKSLIGKLVRYWTLGHEDGTCQYGILQDINAHGFLLKSEESDFYDFIPKDRMVLINYLPSDSEDE